MPQVNLNREAVDCPAYHALLHCLGVIVYSPAIAMLGVGGMDYHDGISLYRTSIPWIRLIDKKSVRRILASIGRQYHFLLIAH